MDGLGSLPPPLFFFEGSSLCFPNDAEKKKEHLFWGGGALSSLLHGFTKYLLGFVQGNSLLFLCLLNLPSVGG